MQNLIQEFDGIDSEAALRAFLQKHQFRLVDSRSHADEFVLGTFIGKIEGRQAKITHRLLDEERASQHRNQVALELDDGPTAEVRFRGNY